MSDTIDLNSLFWGFFDFFIVESLPHNDMYIPLHHYCVCIGHQDDLYNDLMYILLYFITQKIILLY